MSWLKCRTVRAYPLIPPGAAAMRFAPLPLPRRLARPHVTLPSPARARKQRRAMRYTGAERAIRLGRGSESMTAPTEWDALARLLIAAGLTGLLGLEREIRRKEAGLRTFTLVGVGAALFTLVGLLLTAGTGADVTRIAAQV